MSPPKARFYGKVLGGLLGFALLRHPIGILIGAVLGHALDAGWLLRRTKPSVLAEAYGLLEVSPDANEADIDQAYRRLMARYHPDRVANAAEEIRALAEERASAINAAYDHIMAARRRAA